MKKHRIWFEHMPNVWICKPLGKNASCYKTLFTPSDRNKDRQKLVAMATFNALSGTEMSPLLARMLRRKNHVP